MSSRSNPLFLFVIALCAALLLPALFMDGMFIDGVLYAAVSKNYADGHGSFWFMTFSETHHAAFHEQPPLMFFLQGMFFRVFGDSLYTERIYCMIAAFLNGWLIIRAWKIIAGDATTTWLPVLLWFIMPVTFWAFTNNVEECTMSVFVMLAMNAVLRVLFRPGEKNYWWIIAGMWILAAGLTKGVQGMFLLSAPFWFWVILRKDGFKKMITRSLLISLVPAMFVIVAWLTPAINESFTQYFQSRYVKTFSNITANSDNHFHILFELLLDTLPVMFVIAMFLIFGKKTAGLLAHLKSNSRTIIFLLVCAFSGIIPLMVTREQRGFYLVTALPILALGIALVVMPVAQRFTIFITSRIIPSRVISLFSVAAFVAVVAVTISSAGKPKRDADKLAALHEIASVTGNNTILATTVGLDSDWSLLTYAQRFHGIALTANDAMPGIQWFLAEKGSAAPAGYRLIPLKTQVFDLYQRKR